MSDVALSKSTSKALRNGSPAGSLVATCGALKHDKDMSVAMQYSKEAREQGRVYIVPALAIDPFIVTTLYATR
jgi:hypothetical protein